ncbi:MAG: ankyrin repeat domain-containing protein [Deltaproteobacteria bacterium]|nr:ankyrin repeat domain-containing protein [Deltaproteobacteria bacterium]
MRLLPVLFSIGSTLFGCSVLFGSQETQPPIAPGKIPLELTLEENHIEAAKFLLKNGAIPTDVMARMYSHSDAELTRGNDAELTRGNDTELTRGNDTELTRARALANKKRKEIIQLLLQYQADPNVYIEEISSQNTNKIKIPILYAAASRPDETAIVEMLLKAGAYPDQIETIHQRTPLYAAAVNGHIEAAKLLLAAKADPNHKIKNNKTPLHAAIKHGRHDIAELLIEEGADPESTDRNGSAPSDIAPSHADTEPSPGDIVLSPGDIVLSPDGAVLSPDGAVLNPDGTATTDDLVPYTLDISKGMQNLLKKRRAQKAQSSQDQSS